MMKKHSYKDFKNRRELNKERTAKCYVHCVEELGEHVSRALHTMYALT
jgi:hypothetical protein